MNSAIESQLKQIADHYGFTSQANMLTEEAAEYTVALNKLRRGHADAYEHIKEEVADVLVIAYQLRHLLGAEAIDKIIEEKIERQLGRIQEENAWSDEQYKKLNISAMLTKEFWERKANEPKIPRVIDEEGWEEFGKKVMNNERS
jgi:NTP pyrophosphatase (non-canonical NTP hydrolase)